MRSVRRENTGVGRPWRCGALIAAGLWITAGPVVAQTEQREITPPDIIMGSCTNYQASPPSVRVPAAASDGRFELTWRFTPPPNLFAPNTICTIPCITVDCAVLVSDSDITSSDSWLSGEGSFALDGDEFSYVVTYDVDENTGPAPRWGTLSVAGANFTVRQEGAPCPSSPDSVVPSSLDFPYGGGTKPVRVNGWAKCRWQVSESLDWITARPNPIIDLESPSSVSGGGTVNVTAAENDGAALSGTISIGGVLVDVTQDAAPCGAPSVDPDSLTFMHTGGDMDVTVTQADHCESSVSVTAEGDWLRTRAASVTGSRVGVEVTVTARGPYRGTDPRTGTVTVSNNAGDSDSVRVTQLPRRCTNPPRLGMPSLTFEYTGGKLTVSVEQDSECTSTVEVTEVDQGDSEDDWLSASINSDGNVEVDAAGPYTGTTSRTGTVAIGGDGGSVRLIVTQDPPDCNAPTVTPDRLTFPHTGETQMGTVTKDSDCRLPLSVVVDQGDSDENWLSASVDSNGTLTVTATRNTGTSSRMGTVTVSDDGGSTRVDVRQDPPPCPASPDRVSPPELEFRYEGEDKTATVHGPNDCTWDVRVRGTGFRTRDGQTSVSGGGTVTVRAERNDGAERRGTLSVGGETTPLIQNPAPCGSPTVTPDELDFPHEGETRYVTVGGGTDCSWPVSENLSWIEDVPARVSGGDRVPVTATRNYGAFRSGEISFGGAPLRVRQDPAPCTAPSVSPPSLTFAHTGGDLSVEVTQPAHCTATVSVTAGSTWLSRKTTSVTGNGNVVVNAREHTGTASRPGEVTIGNTGGSTPVPVTQNPPPPPEPCTAPAVDPASLTFTDAGGELSVGSDAAGALHVGRERYRHVASHGPGVGDRWRDGDGHGGSERWFRGA